MDKKAILVLLIASAAFIALSGCIQPPVCGNNICELLEDVVNCPNDCRVAFCGNAKCEAGENATNCPKDCAVKLCGNGVIDTGENCANCPADAKCAIGQLCCAGTCTTPACTTDAQCNDKNPATTDRCINPGTCNAACSNTKILEICGDGICSASEDDYTCPEDCGYY